MDAGVRKLRAELKRARFSEQAIDAAWPAWWTDEAAASPSAAAELRFALARRLGLSPRALCGERVEFVWKNRARFKHLGSEDEIEQSVLTSFGVAIGRALIQGCEYRAQLASVEAHDLRRRMLRTGKPFIDLRLLLALCWGVGIPVAHLRVFPLRAKSMHAMVVSADGRYAILLGKDSNYPAQIAFALAHEIAHIALGHIADSPALVDMKDPSEAKDNDTDEKDADRWALALLTGNPEPVIETNIDNFSARSLAEQAKKAGFERRIEPGTLALCLGYHRKTWPVAQKALRFIYDEPRPAWREVNALADSQLSWHALTFDTADYLRTVLRLDG